MSDNSNQEKILWSGRTHFKILAKPAFLQLILIVVHILVAIFIPSQTNWEWWNNWGHLTIHGIIILIEIWYVVIPVMQWLNAGFEITNRKAVSRWGVLYKQAREVPLDSIVSVSVERGILDRIFGCGTLMFQDAAAGFQPETSGAWNVGRGKKSRNGVRFADVPNVLEVQKILDDARYNLRNNR